MIPSDTTTVTATLTSGSGTVAHNTAVAVAGVATFVGLALDTPTGPYTLTFTDGPLTDVVSTTITVGAGAASQLAIVTEPSASAKSGAALAVQPIVKVEDAGGNAIVGNSSTVTATVTSAVGTVTNGTATVSATTGLATFAGLALNELAGPYTLTFSDGTFTTAISTPIAVSAGVATQLVITTQPSATVASGAPLAQAPVVKVEDAAGNVVASDASTVSVKITTGGVSVTPSTKLVVAGVATFTGLTLNALVGPYTLTFSDGALAPATSASIAVTAGTASKLVVATEPSTSTASGVVLAQQPVIKVEDSGGNVVTSVTTGAVTAAITTGAGGTLSAGASANFVAGVATFSGLTLTGTPGTVYTLTYTGDSLIVVDTTQIDVGQAQAALVISSVHATYGRTFALKTTGGSGTGVLSFTVANGTATGCALSGTTLKSATAGTCIVTATKANDATYAAISSAATTVTFAKLAIPGAVRIKFATNSAALPGAGRTAIVDTDQEVDRPLGRLDHRLRQGQHRARPSTCASRRDVPGPATPRARPTALEFCCVGHSRRHHCHQESIEHHRAFTRKDRPAALVGRSFRVRPVIPSTKAETIGWARWPVMSSTWAVRTARTRRAPRLAWRADYLDWPFAMSDERACPVPT